jgi:hypothetical protein
VGSNPIFHPSASEAERCRKTSFCFLCPFASLVAKMGIKTKGNYASSFCEAQSLEVPPRRAEGMGVSCTTCLGSSQSHQIQNVWCLYRTFTCRYGHKNKDVAERLLATLFASAPAASGGDGRKAAQLVWAAANPIKFKI